MMNLPSSAIKLVSAMTLALISFTSDLSPVKAQSTKPVNKTPNSGQESLNPPQSNQTKPSQPSQTKPPPQPNQKLPDFSAYGRPGRRVGGGSRSPCPTIAPPLTALMPMTNWGRTIAERPTFWFYVPYSPQQAPAGEFVLQEEKGNDVYRTAFTLPKTPGFVSFNTPPQTAPLEINKWYHWYFKVYCEPQTSTPVFVEGWVQRVERTPELDRQLKAAKLPDYTIYANNGVWFDALARLAQLRLSNTSNAKLVDDWANLLGARGVNLEQLRQEPIIGQVMSIPVFGSSLQPIAYQNVSSPEIWTLPVLIFVIPQR